MLAHRREALRMANEDVKSHRHATSPFTDTWRDGIKVSNRRLDLSKFPVFDSQQQPMTAIVLVPRERDAARYTKLFREFLRERHRLSATANNVLDFAMYQALPGYGVVHMPAADALVWCEFKQPRSFYEGITELILLGWIARAEKVGYYYLNPNKFFNGNRGAMKFNLPKHVPLNLEVEE